MKKVNSYPVEKKISYLIAKIAPYESLLNYYKKNEMSTKSNKYIQEYLVNKEDIDTIFAQLAKDATIDVYSIA